MHVLAGPWPLLGRWPHFRPTRAVLLLPFQLVCRWGGAVPGPQILRGQGPDSGGGEVLASDALTAKSSFPWNQSAP